MHDYASCIMPAQTMACLQPKAEDIQKKLAQIEETLSFYWQIGIAMIWYMAIYPDPVQTHLWEKNSGAQIKQL